MHPARGIRLGELARTDQARELDRLLAQSAVCGIGSVTKRDDGEPPCQPAADAPRDRDGAGEVPSLAVARVVDAAAESSASQAVAAAGRGIEEPERAAPNAGRPSHLLEEPPARVPALGEAIDRVGEGGAGVHPLTVGGRRGDAATPELAESTTVKQ